MKRSYAEMMAELAVIDMPDEAKARMFEVVATHIAADEAQKERRRAADRVRKQASKIPASVIVEVCGRDGNKCRYCGDTDGPFHIDHIMPASRV